jgi:multiple sugar transport system permease protein
LINQKQKGIGIIASLKKNYGAWLIMLPSILLFAFFVWTPLLENVRLSLYDAKGIRTIDFVGLENYQRVFTHPNFMPALKNTFYYIFWSLLLGFWAPIVIASLITETMYCKGLFRVGVYFPNILPGLASVMLWGFFFRPGKTGVLNILLEKIGIEPFTWLTTPGWTIPLIVLTLTWKAAGSTALIYMAAISNINQELYEAATIDGASPIKRFIHIMLPSILSLGKTLLILQIIAVFQILYEPLVMTNGGPNNASISIMQLVYKYAFEDYNYPMAAALSVMICIVLVALTVVYFKITKNVDKNNR